MTEFAAINTIKRLVRDRRMDRGASSFASMATEDRSKIAREAPLQVVFFKKTGIINNSDEDMI